MLVKRRGRGASVQPPDVAGVAEQVVLQRVAAVAVLVIQLQTAVLGEARMSGGDETKQRAVRPTRNVGAERPALPGGGLDRTVQPPATCHYRALETGLPRNEPGYHCKCTPDPRLRT